MDCFLHFLICFLHFKICFLDAFFVLLKQIRLTMLLVTKKLPTNMHGSVFRLSVIFLWSTSLSLNQYQTVLIILIYSTFLRLGKQAFPHYSFTKMCWLHFQCFFPQMINCQVLKRRQMEFCLVLHCIFTWFVEN